MDALFLASWSLAWIPGNGMSEDPFKLDNEQGGRGGKSRMRREFHVRICESLEAKISWATRLKGDRVTVVPTAKSINYKLILERRTGSGHVNSLKEHGIMFD